MPKISVIVPVYNVEKYLSKCIESIINQTYKDLEIILVDDGSTDNCGKICDEYEKKDNRIIVIHKENGGLSDARNAGLDIAKGEYIGFVDSDDYIDSTMYEKLYESIVKNNSDLVICNYVYVDENGTSIEERNLNMPVEDGVFTQNEIFEKIYADKGFYYITAVNRLYTRELFRNIRFPKGKINEDEFTAHHIFEKCKSIVGIYEPLYYYVQRAGSIMHTKYSVRNFDDVEVRFERAIFMLERNCNNLAFRSCLIGLSKFHFYYTSIDKRDENLKIRIKELQKQYKDIYLKIKKEKNISIIKRIVLTLYYFDLRNCVLVHKTYKLLKGNRTK